MFIFQLKQFFHRSKPTLVKLILILVVIFTVFSEKTFAVVSHPFSPDKCPDINIGWNENILYYLKDSSLLPVSLNAGRYPLTYSTCPGTSLLPNWTTSGRNFSYTGGNQQNPDITVYLSDSYTEADNVFMDPVTLNDSAVIPGRNYMADYSLTAQTTLWVRNPGLIVNPEKIDLGNIKSGDTVKKNRNIFVKNNNDPATQLFWNMASSNSLPSWLTVDNPIEGSLSGGTQHDLSIHVDPSGLTPNNYLVTLSFKGKNKNNYEVSGSPDDVNIEFKIEPPVAGRTDRNFTALFVANQITIASQDSELSIDYDSALIYNIPPGFRELLAPIWEEISP